MSPIVITATGATTAPPALVYAVLKDSTTWPRWSMIGSCEMIRPGTAEFHGVGARRIFRTGPLVVVEEVPELIPDRRVSYDLLAGLPLRDYRANVDLAPTADGGTAITWQSRFFPKIPGTGFLARRFMGRVLRDVVAGLTATLDDPARRAALLDWMAANPAPLARAA